MTSTRSRLALLFAAAALGGCAVVPAYDYGPGYDQPAVIAYAAPPAPLVEYRGLPPAIGYLWIDGYWNWGGARYSWIPGRWVNPPPGQAWAPRVWRRDGDRWHSHGGHWQQHRNERRLSAQPVWPRREFQSQPQRQYQRSPEPLHRQDWRPERQPEPQRRAEGPLHRVLSEAKRMSPAVVPRPEPSPRPAEAAPQRRGGEEGRRMDRKRPEDGEPHDRR